jgi:magnesium transporter
VYHALRTRVTKRSKQQRNAAKREHVAAQRAIDRVSPGELQVDPCAEPPTVHMLGFGPEGFEESTGFDADRLRKLRSKWPVTWVHVVGLGDAKIVAGLGEVFALHPLAVADIVQTYKRPKVERSEEMVQIAIRIVEDVGSSETEQLMIFTGVGFVLSFEERKGDLFDLLRQRLRGKDSYVRQRGADFLAYELIDVTVDAFFPVLEKISDELELIEDSIPSGKPLAATPRLRDIRQQLLGLRRALWPMREVLGALAADPSPIFAEGTRTYLRDCQGHCAQLIDIVTLNRELTTDLVDLQLSVAGQRLGEVMKVLTVMATIFIPLTFVSSIYGMNFDPSAGPLNMPELRWALGYPFALGIMLAVAIGLLLYFRRRGWF